MRLGLKSDQWKTNILFDHFIAHVPGKAGGGWEDSDDEDTNLNTSEHKSMASIELLDEYVKINGKFPLLKI